MCFNAQQSIEKYLKAWLQEANLPVPRTRALVELLYTEWCLVQIAYQGGFYKSSHRRNPLAGGTLTGIVTRFTSEKGYRVLRGGSWGSIAQTVRVADRRRSTPTYASAYVGFRCVKDATR